MNRAIREGLMFRKDSLKPNHGMLFHTGRKYNSFWMKNTYIPLDVIFLDETFKIIGFVENNQPLSLEPIYIYRRTFELCIGNERWMGETEKCETGR